MKPKEGFPDKVLAGLEKHLATLDMALIDSHEGTHADLKALIARMNAAEACLNAKDYRRTCECKVCCQLRAAWLKTRGIGC